MSTTRKILAAAAAVIVVLAIVVGVFAATRDGAPQTSTPTATETTATAPVTEPTVQESTEPDAPAGPVVGDTISADQIDAARDAGLSVFVDPRGDGSGLVVTPGFDLPQQVVAAIAATSGGIAEGPAYVEQESVGAVAGLSSSLQEAGMGAVAIMSGIHVESGTITADGYSIRFLGTARDALHDDPPVFDSLDAAIDAANAIAAQIGGQVFVLV